MSSTKRTWTIVLVLLVVVGIGILSTGFEYWQPVRFSFSIGAGTTMTYETWQNWAIRLEGGGASSYVSAKKTFGVPFSVGTVSGRLYYAEVQIPIKQIGQLPSENLLSGSCTPSTWYNQIEVYGKAKVFFQDEAHLIGEVDLVPVRFGPRDPTATTRNMRLFIGSHDGVRYVRANYQVGTAEAVDVESYMTRLGFSGVRNYVLYVKVVELMTIYKIRPCLPGGTGESIQILKEVSSPEIPGSVVFNLPETWTGTYATTTTWQTQTIGVEGTKTVTVTWIIPSTVVVIQPTTIQGQTFTDVSTTFSGWTTVVTVTNEPPSPLPTWCSIPFFGAPFCALADWLKSTADILGFSLPIWQWVLIAVGIAVLLWLLSRLFAPRV